MDPATMQALFQLGFFGLLCLLGYWVKGWIDDGSKKCDATTAKLGEELKLSHESMKTVLETSIKDANETRIRQVASFDKLTETLNRLPCMQSQEKR